MLEAFSAVEPELPLAELARRAELDNATAFRLLNTLVMLGYVERAARGRNFRLSLKVLDLGFNAIARMEMRERVRPVLRSLVGEVNEAASVAVLDGAEAVYIERVQAGMVRLGVDVRVGSRIPAYCSAVGLAILACLPKSEQIRILGLAPRVKLTPRTVTDQREILARLARVRRDGYIVVDQEITSGLRALAAPALDVDGHPIAAVSVVAPVLRMPLEAFLREGRQPRAGCGAYDFQGDAVRRRHRAAAGGVMG
ncbi:MAG: helix-turn-helix domain-containing protein [Burkholderiales bacterium]|nr:helix-turn-helix domain-containing protein [Burkholderiales bacterium]